MAGQPWEQAEVEAAVADYFAMLADELSGTRYNKSEHRSRLRARLLDRSDASVEKKHQNISAILAEHGLPRILGYRPLGNYQSLLERMVLTYLEDHPELMTLVTHSDAQIDLPQVSESNFSHFFEDPPHAHPLVTERRNRSYGARTIDYASIEPRRRLLGLRGEEFVVALERERLMTLGEPSLAGAVRHVSLLDGDGAGYDVLSFDGDGGKRYIEVKTTVFAKTHPFQVSINEVEFAEDHADAFRLYRVFHFGAEPRVFVKDGAIRKAFALEPTEFRAFP